MPDNYCAMYFHHPDFDRDSAVNGLQIAPTGRLTMVAEEQSIRQAILLLLSTTRGERVMRADYGCDLNQLVFMPTDETTLGFAIHLVRQALQQWEPRIDILQLDADYNKNEPYRMDIVLEYRVRRSGATDRLTLTRTLT